MVTGPLLLLKVKLPAIVKLPLHSCPLVPLVVTEPSRLLAPDTEIADKGVVPPTAPVNVLVPLPLLTVNE